MTPFNQYEYLKLLGAKHKLIQHTDDDAHVHIISSVFNLEEFQSEMNNTDGVQVLSVNLDDYSAVGANANTISDSVFNTFWIVKKAIGGDPENKTATRETCKTIANNFVGRMKKQCGQMLENKISRTQLMHLDALTFSIRAYELPIGDNYIGVQVNYRIVPPTAMKDDPTAWMD